MIANMPATQIGTRDLQGESLMPPKGGVSLFRGNFKGRNKQPVSFERTLIPATTTDMQVSVAPDINPSGYERATAGPPVYRRSNGEVISDPQKMRCDSWSLSDHIEHIYSQHPHDICAAVTFGNVITNEECVVVVQEDDHMKAYCRSTELDRFPNGHYYYALGVQIDGVPWAGRVAFKPKAGGVSILNEGGKDISSGLRLVVTGPPLVWDREPLRIENTVSRWSDLRHVLSLFSCPLPNGKSMLFGEPNLKADKDLLTRAVKGEPIELPLTWPGSDNPSKLPDRLVKEMIKNAKASGYIQMSDTSKVRRPGIFALKNESMVICFRPGLYPHNLLGLSHTADTWVDLQVGGVSTRSGCTLEEAATLLHGSCAAYAIGLDQGADPQLLVHTGDHYFYKPSFIHRSRISATIAWTSRAPDDGDLTIEKKPATPQMESQFV